MKRRRRRSARPNRWHHEVATSATCECGASRMRPDGTIAPACPSCAALDGSYLSVSAAAVIAELRVMGPSNWEQLRLEMSGYSSRQIARAVAELQTAGRVRRREVVVPTPGVFIGVQWGTGRPTTHHRDTRSVAFFELVAS